MSTLRITLRKCLAMLGGAGSAILVALAVCFCAYALRGVFASQKADAIAVDVVASQTDAATERILERMQEGGNIAIQLVDEKTAQADLTWGRTEGVLTLPVGFLSAAMQGDPSFSYQSAPESASSAYVLERFSSALISYRIYENCIRLRMDTGLSREDAAAQVAAAWEEASATQGAGYTVVSQDPQTVSVGGVFSQVFAKASGFVAMLVMFLLASSLQWLILEDAKRVSDRLDSQRLGRILGKGTDLAAMLMIGMTAVILCGAVMGTLTARYVLCFFAYCLFLGGFFLLLSGVLRANGQVQIFVPFVTLVTSIAGGCLFDLTAVSSIWQKAALFTPQGLLLHALRQQSVFPVMLLMGIGGVAFVLSLLSRRAV